MLSWATADLLARCGDAALHTSSVETNSNGGNCGGCLLADSGRRR